MAKNKNYYNTLEQRESSNNPTKENPKTHYIGLYQMGEAALVDAGYYTKAPQEGQKPGTQYNNDWSGAWTGKNGINSKEDFLNKREIQDTAIQEYHQKVWGYLKDYQKYEGQEVGGIKLDKSGMISAAHLVGHLGLKHFIDSNGQTDDKDSNGVTCSQYLAQFTGYEIDISPSVQSQLEQQQPSVTDTYKIQQGDNLSSIAQKNNMTLEQLLAIPGNEQFKADPNAIQPNQEVKLKSPEVSNQDKHQQPPTTNVQTQETTQQQIQEANIHEVKGGDTLSTIAQAQGKTVEEILSIPGNEQFKDNPDKINIGDKVNLSAPNIQGQNENTSVQAINPEEVKQQEESQTNKDQSLNDKTVSIHEVKEGDTLSQIAQDNNSTTEQLAADNNINDPDHIEAGQDINVSGNVGNDNGAEDNNAINESAGEVVNNEGTSHTVEAGDTLSEIAQENDTTVEQLAADNDISNPDHIEVGQDISLAGDSNDYP